MENITTIYDLRWGKINKIKKKDIKEALRMIFDVNKETNYKYGVNIVEKEVIKMYCNR